MTAEAKTLLDTLSRLDWKENIGAFGDSTNEIERVAKCNHRIAVWVKQLELIDEGNPAICFARELQLQGFHAATLIALSLYRPAANAMRSMIEAALYYTYFRNHPVELASLSRSDGFYIGKAEVLDFHRIHTPRFKECEQALALVNSLDHSYKTLSAVVHGQIPGMWYPPSQSLAVKFSQEILNDAVDKMQSAEESIHRLFLCTSGREVWDRVGVDAKRFLLKGLPGKAKTVLGLSTI